MDNRRAVLSAALLAALCGDPWPAPVYLPSGASGNGPVAGSQHGGSRD